MDKVNKTIIKKKKSKNPKYPTLGRMFPLRLQNSLPMTAVSIYTDVSYAVLVFCIANNSQISYLMLLPLQMSHFQEASFRIFHDSFAW